MIANNRLRATDFDDSEQSSAATNYDDNEQSSAATNYDDNEQSSAGQTSMRTNNKRLLEPLQ